MSQPLENTVAPGIRERHTRSCPGRGACTCQPSYSARVSDKHTGKRINSGSFSSEAEAVAWREQALIQVQEGRLSRTIKQAAEAWLAGAEASPPTVVAKSGLPYKPSVLRDHRRALELYILPELGAVRITALDQSEMQQFADRLAAKGLSPSRIRNILMPLRVIFRLERQQNRHLKINPTRDLALPHIDLLAARERTVKPHEAERLFAALGPATRAIFGIAYYSGLRRGELQALRWDDVDLVGGLLRVNRSWDAKAGAVSPKTPSGTRAVPINAKLRSYLEAEKERTGRGGADLVLGATRWRPFVGTTVGRRARAAWKVDAADAPVTLNGCRHSYIVWMREAGHSLEELAHYVGHTASYMIDRYPHLLEGYERQAAERQDEHLAKRRRRFWRR